nr:MAG TPA_asm: hypothetical protein [Caudoviricetes sp.]
MLVLLDATADCVPQAHILVVVAGICIAEVIDGFRTEIMVIINPFVQQFSDFFSSHFLYLHFIFYSFPWNNYILAHPMANVNRKVKFFYSSICTKILETFGMELYTISW